MPITLQDIRVYPVKGLSGQPLDRADLAVGAVLPDDRRFAIAHGASRFDPAEPGWQKKSQFLQLCHTERLAQLDSNYDVETGVLTLSRDGRRVAGGDIRTQLGRDLVNQFLAAFLSRDEARGAPKLVEAPGVSFTDAPEPWLSIINLASVRDLAERILRRPVDPLRFRGNLMIDGGEPWAELGWEGRRIAIGGAVLEGMERIGRCAATNVDPGSGERDLNIPRTLLKSYGHTDCGLYVRVVQGGPIAAGDEVTVEEIPGAGRPGDRQDLDATGPF